MNDWVISYVFSLIDLLIFLAVITFPIAVAKWLFAILQGITAAKNLAGLDAAEREAQRQKTE